MMGVVVFQNYKCVDTMAAKENEQEDLTFTFYGDNELLDISGDLVSLKIVSEKGQTPVIEKNNSDFTRPNNNIAKINIDYTGLAVGNYICEISLTDGVTFRQCSDDIILVILKAA